jgi:hypothetical protein
LPAFVFDDFGGDLGDLGLADVEGDFVTAIGVPEFGAVGEVSVVEEAAGARVVAEVFKFSVVVGPVEEPVPVEVFELI